VPDKWRNDKSEAGTTTESIWALVPIKRLEKAKQCLATALEPKACAEFACTMALDVFAVAARTRRLGGVAVRAAQLKCACKVVFIPNTPEKLC
jgi:2-phospho-L-lactate guanylyltransferase (CobY/MobA/RfbA family)